MCTSHFCEIQFIAISVSLSMYREVQHGKVRSLNAMAYRLLVQSFRCVTVVSCKCQSFYKHQALHVTYRFDFSHLLFGLASCVIR